MEDLQIIDLYVQRNENAISETAKKYGAFCQNIAVNILRSAADAEECVNDSYLQAWNCIPPQRPERLGAWLGKVVRNAAINLWNKNHRKKRYMGMEQLLGELEECIPSPLTIERELEERELTDFLNRWLASLPKADRMVFVRRYWCGEAVNDLAANYKVTPASMAKRMYRLRHKLKSALEKEGYSI